MKMDILDFGTENTVARYSTNKVESAILMEACAALREARFPGALDRLPRMFDEEDLAAALGNEEAAAEFLAIMDLEQAFHQALHLFPGGHSHGHEHDDLHDEA
jgi:hypothetical protein